MNLVFAVILTACIGYMLFTAPDAVMPALLEGGATSITFSLKLLVIYAVWLSVLDVLEKSKLDLKLAKLIHPITKRLFKDENDAAYKYINLNLSTNLLGMGGAATPLGIKAVENIKSKKNKIMLVVLNATSVQLIPTTILSMRADIGATTDIMLPSVIVNVLTTVFAVILVKVFVK